MPRYTVRPSHADGQITIWRVYDQVNRLFVIEFTREVLAEAAARRLNAEHKARLYHATQAEARR